METKFQHVIHFGTLMNQSIVDHSIDEKIWSQIMSLYINQTDEYNIKHQRYQKYQHNNTNYECDLDLCEGVHYTEEISEISMLTFPQEKLLGNALQYKHKKLFLNDLCFLPHNRYYNIQTIDSYEISPKNQEFNLIFEKKNNKYEIKLITTSQLSDSLKLVVDCRDMYSRKIDTKN